MSNRCEAAIEMVEAADAKGDAGWYSWLANLKLDCMAKTGDRRYGEGAVRLLADGMERFPRSSRLVFLRGFANGQLGEWGVEQRYYEDALKLAKENIAAEKDGQRAADDRLVAATAEANLKASWKHTK